MKLGDSDSFIDLELRESMASNMPRAGDLRLRVTLHGSGFTAVQEDVWIPDSAAVRFLDDLNAMAAGQGEEAVPKDATAGESTLRFTLPMPSHALVEGKLKPIEPGSPATISASVAFAIDVVRADLRDITEALSESWARPAHSRAH